MQLHVTFLLFHAILIYSLHDLSKVLEKKTDPLLKIFKIEHFSEVWELHPADLDRKAK